MRSAVGLFSCRGSWGREKLVPHCAQRDIWGIKKSGLGEEEEERRGGRGEKNLYRSTNLQNTLS